VADSFLLPPAFVSSFYNFVQNLRVLLLPFGICSGKQISEASKGVFIEFLNIVDSIAQRIPSRIVLAEMILK
jgi:hypothetical protein